MPEEPEQNLSIKDLYPDLTPEEQKKAEENLKGYMRVVWKIYKRRFHLTGSDQFGQMMGDMLPPEEEE